MYGLSDVYVIVLKNNVLKFNLCLCCEFSMKCLRIIVVRVSLYLFELLVFIELLIISAAILYIDVYIYVYVHHRPYENNKVLLLARRQYMKLFFIGFIRKSKKHKS